jgi:hypothetical protein
MKKVSPLGLGRAWLEAAGLLGLGWTQTAGHATAHLQTFSQLHMNFQLYSVEKIKNQQFDYRREEVNTGK